MRVPHVKAQAPDQGRLRGLRQIIESQFDVAQLPLPRDKEESV
jgi:hypothetical protein